MLPEGKAAANNWGRVCTSMLTLHKDPLGGKPEIWGIYLALGSEFVTSLGNIPGAILAPELVQQHLATQPLHLAALHIFTSLQKNPLINNVTIFRKTKIAQAHSNIEPGAPEQLSCTSLWAGSLPAPACNLDWAVFLSQFAPTVRPGQTCILFKTGCKISQVKKKKKQPKPAVSFKVFQHLGMPCLFGLP